ncbi:hypothetical protein HF1_11430 [Mycoplasma haemofelis str. Langford 1]|uniref:Lipoprotein n=1 Tax=Mycoplasma haemofelis (strain Langford 1) TaxID=941640 RepID=E8ZJ30_MYCHL|nr:hypothetical protein [Mycoplasma haemofelis]CBY93151.1 hypothetical protein HF1_11430 [Mycoplasma haemofelis str. Langford 1]
MKLGTAAASIGGASAASAAAVGGYHYLSQKETVISIREALKDAKLISTLTGDALTKQWVTEFKSAQNDIKEKIQELKSVTSEEDGGKKLESWCLKQMDLDSKKHSETLELVKKYCLIRDLASQLSRNKKVLLGKSQQSEWSALYKKHKGSSATRADVGLTGETWSENKENDELPVIQNWCEGTSKQDFLASDNDTKYNKLIKWCTADGQ